MGKLSFLTSRSVSKNVSFKIFYPYINAGDLKINLMHIQAHVLWQQYQDPEAAKWNSAIIHFYVYSTDHCRFVLMHSDGSAGHIGTKKTGRRQEETSGRAKEAGTLCQDRSAIDAIWKDWTM